MSHSGEKDDQMCAHCRETFSQIAQRKRETHTHTRSEREREINKHVHCREICCYIPKKKKHVYMHTQRKWDMYSCIERKRPMHEHAEKETCICTQNERGSYSGEKKHRQPYASTLQRNIQSNCTKREYASTCREKDMNMEWKRVGEHRNLIRLQTRLLLTTQLTINQWCLTNHPARYWGRLK